MKKIHKYFGLEIKISEFGQGENSWTMIANQFPDLMWNGQTTAFLGHLMYDAD